MWYECVDLFTMYFLPGVFEYNAIFLIAEIHTENWWQSWEYSENKLFEFLVSTTRAQRV